MANSTTPTDQYAPGSDLLQALGITQDQYNNLPSSDQVAIRQLQGLIGKLNTPDYDNALQTIQGQAMPGHAQIPNFLGSNVIATGSSVVFKPGSLTSLVQGLQSKIPAGYVAPPNPTPNTIPTVSNAPAITNLGVVSNTAPSELDWQQLQTIMGTDPKAAYQAYVANQQQAGQPPSSEAQWFSQQLGNINGQYAPLIQSLNASYLVAQGTSMPVALQSQLVSQLEDMRKSAPDLYNEVVAQLPQIQQTVQSALQNPTSSSVARIGQALTSAGFSATGNLASLYNTFNEYVNVNPSTYYQQDEITAQNASAFRSQTGLAPTPDQIKSMQGMDAESLNNYIASQKSPIPGVELGTYSTALKTMEPLWQSTFHRNPTNQEIQMMAGWNAEDINNWVNSQRSLDNPTMTVGERQGYLNASDALSQKLFGVPADSRMADILDGHFNPNAAPPAPKPLQLTVTPPGDTNTAPPITTIAGAAAEVGAGAKHNAA